MKKAHLEACRGIAYELIESEGASPEYLSVVELVGEYAREQDLEEDEQDAMVEKTNDLITNALITVTIPEDVD